MSTISSDAPAPSVLSTARLDLVPLGTEALNALMQGTRQPDWAPDFPQPMDVDAATAAFREGLHAMPAALTQRLIRERADGAVIGSIGFTGLPLAGAAELTFSVVPSRRGRGLAAEAVTAVAELALSAQGVESISAYVNEANEASAALLLSAGFVPVESVGAEVRLLLRQPPAASASAELK